VKLLSPSPSVFCNSQLLQTKTCDVIKNLIATVALGWQYLRCNEKSKSVSEGLMHVAARYHGTPTPNSRNKCRLARPPNCQILSSSDKKCARYPLAKICAPEKVGQSSPESLMTCYAPMPLIVSTFIAVGQTMYEKSVTKYFTPSVFSSRSDNLSTRYLRQISSISLTAWPTKTVDDMSPRRLPCGDKKAAEYRGNAAGRSIYIWQRYVGYIVVDQATAWKQ